MSVRRANDISEAYRIDSKIHGTSEIEAGCVEFLSVGRRYCSATQLCTPNNNQLTILGDSIVGIIELFHAHGKSNCICRKRVHNRQSSTLRRRMLHKTLHGSMLSITRVLLLLCSSHATPTTGSTIVRPKTMIGMQPQRRTHSDAHSNIVAVETPKRNRAFAPIGTTDIFSAVVPHRGFALILTLGRVMLGRLTPTRDRHVHTGWVLTLGVFGLCGGVSANPTQGPAQPPTSRTTLPPDARHSSSTTAPFSPTPSLSQTWKLNPTSAPQSPQPTFSPTQNLSSSVVPTALPSATTPPVVPTVGPGWFTSYPSPPPSLSFIIPLPGALPNESFQGVWPDGVPGRLAGPGWYYLIESTVVNPSCSIPARLGGPTVTFDDLFGDHFTWNPTSVYILIRFEPCLTDLGVFGSMPQLEQLLLPFNSITRIRASTFTNLPALLELGLYGNPIEVVEIGSFSAQTRLGTLNLYNNKIAFFPAGLFSNPSNLTTLNLYSQSSPENRTTIEPGAFSGLTRLTHLNLESMNLTLLPQTIFHGLPGLQYLSFANNNISIVHGDTFQNLTFLSVLRLTNNPITLLGESTFNGLVNLRFFEMDHIRVTSISAAVFRGCRALNILNMKDGLLTSLPTGVFRGLTTLESVALQRNRITYIEDNLFSDLPQLSRIDFRGNRITSVASNAFMNLTNLTIMNLGNNALTVLPEALLVGIESDSMDVFSCEYNNITHLPQQLLESLGHLSRVETGPNPLVCHRVNASIQCDTCSRGYLFDNVTSSCVRPPFGPVPSLRWQTISTTANVLGAPETPATLYLGATYPVSAPNLLPKDTHFTGYTGSFEKIAYRADFETATASAVNLTCSATGTVIVGNTTGMPHSRGVPNPLFGWPGCTASSVYPTNSCGPKRMFTSAAALYVFDVAEGGANITFDTCGSDFITSLAVFKLNETNPTGFRRPVFPTNLQTIVVGTNWVSVPVGPIIDLGDGRMGQDSEAQQRLDVTEVLAPQSGGCPLSNQARTPRIHFAQSGLYSVEVGAGTVPGVQGSDLLALPTEEDGRALSGRFILRMTCDSADQTVPPVHDRIGIDVDSRTGGATVTPTVAGTYSFNLTAVDAGGSGASATISEWSINVTERPVFQRLPTPFFYSPRTNDTTIVGINRTYIFRPPTDSDVATTYFANVTGPLQYSLVISSEEGPNLRDELLVSPQTGLFQLRARGAGAYNVRVVATDGSRQVDVLATNWNFEVRPPSESWNDVNGPNNRGCENNGRQVESPLRDGTYTCDCTNTGLAGDNCATEVPTSGADTTTNRITGGILGALLFLFVCAALWSQRQAYIARNQPTNFDEIRTQLLKELGVGPQLDVATDEIGFALTLSHVPDHLEDLAEVKTRIVAALSAAAKTKQLVWVDAEVRILALHRSEVAVVVKNPPGRSKSAALTNNTGVGDRALAHLLRAIDVGRLQFEGADGENVVVISASLMTPKRIPREIDRGTVLRLNKLGSGVSASVYKAQIKEVSGRTILVASKELNQAGNDASASRADAEKEAAFMALLEHPHIVALFGVVSVPKTMPTVSACLVPAVQAPFVCDHVYVCVAQVEAVGLTLSRASCDNSFFCLSTVKTVLWTSTCGESEGVMLCP